MYLKVSNTIKLIALSSYLAVPELVLTGCD